MTKPKNVAGTPAGDPQGVAPTEALCLRDSGFGAAGTVFSGTAAEVVAGVDTGALDANPAAVASVDATPESEPV